MNGGALCTSKRFLCKGLGGMFSEALGGGISQGWVCGIGIVLEDGVGVWTVEGTFFKSHLGFLLYSCTQLY